MKERLIAALREQASESMRLIGEPSYSTYDCLENARSFGTVADWLADNWDDIFPEERA